MKPIYVNLAVIMLSSIDHLIQTGQLIFRLIYLQRNCPYYANVFIFHSKGSGKIYKKIPLEHCIDHPSLPPQHEIALRALLTNRSS